MDSFVETTAGLKRARILDAALRLLLAYGYSRTTMDDIARAAEMSRPALYLLFRNKSDICRAIAISVMQRSGDAARQALSGEGSFSARMEAAVEKSILAVTRPFAESPHGAELLDMKTNLCGDLVEGWCEDLTRLFAEAIGDEAGRNRIDLEAHGLSARGMAELLLDGIGGARRRFSDCAAQQQAARGAIQVIARALRA
jgi:AcrR family transcriptional regulator